MKEIRKKMGLKKVRCNNSCPFNKEKAHYVETQKYKGGNLSTQLHLMLNERGA